MFFPYLQVHGDRAGFCPEYIQKPGLLQEAIALPHLFSLNKKEEILTSTRAIPIQGMMLP